MADKNGGAGLDRTNISGVNGAKLANDAERAWREAQGATPLSPFEFVPPLGFRGYCYPALFKQEVGPKKPVFVKIMEEEIAFFRYRSNLLSPPLSHAFQGFQTPGRNLRLQPPAHSCY